MADPIEGKLIWQGEGKNRKRLLSWKNTKGGMTMPNRFSDDQLAAELRTNEDASVDVHLELENGQPRRIRPIGTNWAAPTPVAQVATTRVTERNAPQNQRGHLRDEGQSRQANNPKRQVEMRNINGDFHNPYNFVPAPPRATSGELGDCKPSGHARYKETKLSGKLCIEMTVKSPLLLLDTARVKVHKFGNKSTDIHKQFEVRVDSDGKPLVSPTAAKGMLRSAYEAITNSRLSVFHEHDERLAFRMESNKGAEVVPVRIEEENGQKKIVFYTGTSTLKSNGEPESGNPLCAAWLFRYHTNREVSNAATKYQNGRLPQHKDEVKVFVEKFEHYKWKWIDKRNGIGGLAERADFIFWQVREIASKKESLGNKPEPTIELTRPQAEQRQKSYYRPLGVVQEANGIVFVSNHNMQNKHDEKVFFKSESAPDPEILSDEKWGKLKKAWKELIKNYQTEHENEKAPPSNLKIKEWSRHIQHKGEQELAVGTLCYAKVKSVGENQFEVEYLLPVMISRKLYECPPENLLPDCLKPASDRDDLSPADRVFGFVNQKGEGAYRGQIRVGAVHCLTKKEDAIESFEKPLPLQILGQPKPQQGRFYVAQTIKGEAQEPNLMNEDAGYKKGKGLRGRKVYPPHNVPVEYWNASQTNPINHNGKLYYREYRRPQDTSDNQNRSIEGWVKRDTTFTFDLHFINLSKVELGGLIWLLQLGENHFHRFGGGKPLGFGSVQLTLKESEILSGEEIKKRYASLDGEAVGTTTANDCQTAFQDEIASAYPDANFLRAFKQAAQGFSKPVHYPRLDSRPNSEGKNFEWFVANNSNDGFKLPLPHLTEDTGLPLQPKNQREGRR